MITRDTVRLGAPVKAAGRVLTPVLHIRYTIGSGSSSAGAFGAVDPVGVVLEEAGATFYFAFDLLKGWDWVSARLEV
jgi:hypothetical protein